MCRSISLCSVLPVIDFPDLCESYAVRLPSNTPRQVCGGLGRGTAKSSDVCNEFICRDGITGPVTRNGSPARLPPLAASVAERGVVQEFDVVVLPKVPAFA